MLHAMRPGARRVTEDDAITSASDSQTKRWISARWMSTRLKLLHDPTSTTVNERPLDAPS